MLPLKKPTAETESWPDTWKWNVGIDRKRVAAYVGLALFAGFVFGFFTARQVTPNQTDEAARLALSRKERDLPPVQEAAAASETFYRVTRVARADTVEVEGVGLARMIGVEVPEGRPQYAAHVSNALAFTEKSLAGQEVRLEFDEMNAARGNKDESGQTLAYVYTRDGKLINAELVRQGYAFMRGNEPFRLAEEFRIVEREALQAMRGLWGPDNPSGASLAAAAPAGQTSTPTGQEDKPRRLTPMLPSEIGPNLPALSGSPATPGAAASEPAVLVSSSDRLYHKSGCEYLSKQRRALPLSQARSEGYTACSRCYPSTSMKAQ